MPLFIYDVHLSDLNPYSQTLFRSSNIFHSNNTYPPPRPPTPPSHLHKLLGRHHHVLRSHPLLHRRRHALRRRRHPPPPLLPREAAGITQPAAAAAAAAASRWGAFNCEEAGRRGSASEQSWRACLCIATRVGPHAGRRPALAHTRIAGPGPINATSLPDRC